MDKKTCELVCTPQEAFDKGCCPQCYNRGFYYRKKTGDYRCPHCKAVWPKSFSELVPLVVNTGTPSDMNVENLAVVISIKSGKTTNENSVKAILCAAGVTPDEDRILAALEVHNIKKFIETKTVISEAETTEALMDVAERMGYSRQEPGHKPILLFITDELYDDIQLRRGGMSTSAYLVDYINRAIDCAGGLDDVEPVDVREDEEEGMAGLGALFG